MNWRGWHAALVKLLGVLTPRRRAGRSCVVRAWYSAAAEFRRWFAPIWPSSCSHSSAHEAVASKHAGIEALGAAAAESARRRAVLAQPRSHAAIKWASEAALLRWLAHRLTATSEGARGALSPSRTCALLVVGAGHRLHDSAAAGQSGDQSIAGRACGSDGERARAPHQKLRQKTWSIVGQWRERCPCELWSGSWLRVSISSSRATWRVMAALGAPCLAATSTVDGDPEPSLPDACALFARHASEPMRMPDRAATGCTIGKSARGARPAISVVGSTKACSQLGADFVAGAGSASSGRAAARHVHGAAAPRAVWPQTVGPCVWGDSLVAGRGSRSIAARGGTIQLQPRRGCARALDVNDGARREQPAQLPACKASSIEDRARPRARGLPTSGARIEQDENEVRRRRRPPPRRAGSAARSARRTGAGVRALWRAPCRRVREQRASAWAARRLHARARSQARRARSTESRARRAARARLAATPELGERESELARAAHRHPSPRTRLELRGFVASAALRSRQRRRR